ncbi:hypothetical protein CERSUDRAFT_118525 [Gelatoporia subvermispora B]|uniref:Uncharacterized protein n=1 Tax=Ceriporiopsis subvermispora (strain B) TaxID=914234 RepID=M2R1S7_CERS8|nr:hypothetical protein CERSUDRAFT_118525 [Gelatoporia subvermispora B]
MTHTTTTPISVTLSSGASKAQETSDPSGDDGSDDPGDDDGSASLSDFPTPSIPFPSGNSNGVAPAGVNNIVTSSCLVTAFMITIALSL